MTGGNRTWRRGWILRLGLARLGPPQEAEVAAVKLVTTVRTPTRSYPVYSGTDVSPVLRGLWQPQWRQAAIIGDETTAGLFGQAVREALDPLCGKVEILSFPSGEDHKTRESKEGIEDRLLADGFDRTCCVVAVGGGIALDVGGYVAATFLRGVPHVNVATSLLAQVDAAIGGKTGVNTPAGKNLIGALHQPHGVVLDLASLASLPEGEIRNGLAEAVKHGVVADASLFADLEAWAKAGARPLPEDLLARCVRVKADIVARDEEESGLRRVLNFGHTVAHALEAASHHRMPHGAAVSAGMVVEARVAEAVTGFPTEATARLTAVLETLGLPTDPGVDFEDALPYMVRDKKSLEGAVRFSLPLDLGEMAPADGDWALAAPRGTIEAAWRAPG
ncbi:MAG: 3-dehydroquinate synthase [Gemmatimonadota bacterium]|nr:3-dehydroquinate synthase [Gemmatimonadota bacterium]